MSMKVDVWEMAWGLPWEPEEFMQRAAESDHPRSMGSVLPQPLEEALDSLEDMSVAEERRSSKNGCTSLFPYPLRRRS